MHAGSTVSALQPQHTLHGRIGIAAVPMSHAQHKSQHECQHEPQHESQHEPQYEFQHEHHPMLVY